jgi:hypothetical protein
VVVAIASRPGANFADPSGIEKQSDKVESLKALAQSLISPCPAVRRANRIAPPGITVTIIQFSGLFPASIAARLHVNHVSSILAILGKGVTSTMFGKEMANPVNSKWRIAAIILAVVALSQGLELFRIKSALKNVFHYDVRVTLKDKATGEILRGITTHGPSISTDDLFNQSTRFGGGMEASEISGIAYEPREFGFSADGYERVNLVVTDDTPWSVVVELDPKKSKAEQGGAGQPATRSESDSEGGDKPQPGSDGRSR